MFKAIVFGATLFVAGVCMGTEPQRGSVSNKSGVVTHRTYQVGNTARLYTGNGSYAGRATYSGSSARYYDSRGRSLGTSTTIGGTTRFYGPKGNYQGAKR